MDENSVAVDLDRLRAVANRVERSANALMKFRFPGLDADEMRGSAVAGVASPAALVAARLDEVIFAMVGWAAAARISADALAGVDREAARHLGRS